MKFFFQPCFFFFCGCTLLLSLSSCDYVDHLAGTPIFEAPFFKHHETFIEGQNLHVAIDPARFASKVGKTYSVYVVEHKTTAQWDADPSLVDVTGTVETAILTSGTLESNKILAWANMTLSKNEYPWLKQYDIVFDFNNDGLFKKSDDVVDKIGVLELLNGEESGGFTLIKDPLESGSFKTDINVRYDLGTFSITKDLLPCDCWETTDVSQPLVDLPIKGVLFFPKPSKDEKSPQKYPLIIVAHGNNNSDRSYGGFAYLGQLLASRGYVVASIDLCHKPNGFCQIEQGLRTYHRGLIINEHIERLLFSPMTDTFIQNTVRPLIDVHQIGLVGHSRGGEGIIAAEQVFRDKNISHYTIKALASLAPSDATLDVTSFINNIQPCNQFKASLPYLMIYGTRDSDRKLGEGYRLLDKAQRDKFGITLNGGYHNFFNATWSPESSSGAIPSGILGSNEQNLLRKQQENFTKSYLHAFFNIFLRSEQAYFSLFSGSTPPALTPIAKNTVLHSYQPKGWNNVRLPIDEFEIAPPATNDLGALNGFSPSTSTYTEHWLGALGTWEHLPYYSNGLTFEWNNASNSLTFGLPIQDVKYYNYLSFRIGRKYKLPVPPSALPTPADYERYDVSIILKDNAGNSSFPIKASAYVPSKIFYTDVEANIVFRKSILQTVVIPLRAFTANGSNVNLAKLKAVVFTFESSEGKKQFIIDDVEFLGIDPSKPDPGIL